MNSTIDFYKDTPIKLVDDIPIFSQSDEYVDNYDQISSDHVSAITQENENPFIIPEVWDIIEDETLALALKYIEKSGSGKKTVLDVGVGLGRLLSKISMKSTCPIEMHGIDISMHYLKIAKEKEIKVALAKIEDIPYRKDYFDVITCTDVLEHVFDLNLAIEKIVECLRPGGYLIVRVPNREDLSGYLKRDYPYRFAHVRDFNEYSLELLFSTIFNFEFCEKKNSLFIENYRLLKWLLPVRGYNYLVLPVLNIIRRISMSWYRKTIENIFHPTEINIVLRKPEKQK